METNYKYYKQNDILHRIHVEQDDECNPRVDNENVAVMQCFANRYNLGDKHVYNGDEEDFLKLCVKSI